MSAFEMVAEILKDYGVEVSCEEMRKIVNAFKRDAREAGRAFAVEMMMQKLSGNLAHT